MSRDDMIQNAKDAKFQIEFMAMMLLSKGSDTQQHTRRHRC